MDSLFTTDSKLNKLWQDLAEVDEEISNLYEKRKDVQREINRRLSLINRLPFEVLSRILTLSTESNRVSASPDNECYKWCAVLLLGAVCREWREITLATHHLWSTVTIRPYYEDALTNITNEWLQRSGALPLSITIIGSYSFGDFDTLLETLRSHSIRWKSLTFNYVPEDIFYRLLDNLEDTRLIETIRILGKKSWGKMRPFMGEPIRPKTFHWLRCSNETGTAYFKWDNLTHLVVEDIHIDNLTDILRQAIKIQHCVVKSSREGKEHQLVPTVNMSLMHLDIEFWNLTNFLPFLTLPSLQILECRDWGFCMNRVYVDVLVDFIDRSQATLRDVICHLKVDNCARLPVSSPGLCNRRFPNITHLNLSVQIPNDDTAMLIKILERLAYDRGEIAHPSLRVIELTADGYMTPTVWSHFINLFPQILAEQTHHERLPTNPSDTDLTISSDSPLRRRLSKACMALNHWSKTFDERDVMELHQYLRLLDIQKSGVELELIGNGGIDLLQFAKKIYGSELEARQQYQQKMTEDGL
ncbi:hypothetical protein CVT25_000196 [Psilocybe cyanescens]|uniref:F-box domain-containing protein n=1 Tax=Psilocybe cyanescens TaxID=93625 RepID=A0A409XQK8_PSICY|nr:hypothetical protein CVT25_000196 [Psilocybe cyanescens]